MAVSAGSELHSLRASDRLLLAAVANPAMPTGYLDDLYADDFPWQEAMTAAAENRVASFVATLLERQPLESRVPAEIRADWRALQMLQVFRAEFAGRQLRETATALAKAGVTPLLYKGLDFQERLYSETCPRAFSDLDLVIRSADVEAAVIALEAAGYTPHLRGLPLWFHRRFHLHVVFEHPDHRRPLELHWALDSPYADLTDPLPLVFEAAETCGAFGPDVLRPTAVDALALMSIHLERHIGLCATLRRRRARLSAVLEARGLVWVLDVVRWLRTQPEALRGAEAERRIRELHAARSVVVALRLANDLDPSALPEWARALAERLPHGRPPLRRLVYPDLATGLEATERGRRRRRWLLTMSPTLGFRPVRVLEALLPRHVVPGTGHPWRTLWPIRTLRQCAKIGAALITLATVRRRQNRLRALAVREPSSRSDRGQRRGGVRCKHLEATEDQSGHGTQPL
jgi:hypothetical protein